MDIIKFFTVLFVCAPALIFSQTTIKGKVTDIHGNLPFANISLQSGDKIYVGTITDDEGKFSLEADKGSYVLVISFIGYKTLTKEISIVEQNIDLAEIRLTEESNELDEVVITQRRKLIEKKSDHFVVNLSNKNFLQNANSWQTLKKAPLLSAKESRGLSILGKNDVSVYINNRKSNFSGETLINYLKNLPAKSIKKIEIYTSPPARFDAQGNGVINIIMEPNPQEGLVGSASAVLRQSQYNAGRASLDLNYNKGKWNAYTSTWITEGKTYVSEYSAQQFPNLSNTSTHDTDRLNPSTLGVGTKIGVDFNASNTHILGLLLDFNFSKPKIENKTLSNYFTNTVQDSLTLTTVDGKNEKLSYNININHVYKTDTLGSSLSWNFDYFKYKNDQFTENNNFLNNSTIPSQSPIDNFNSGVVQEIENYNIKADYYQVLSDKWNFSLGAQYFQTTTDNEIDLRRFNAGEYIIDPNTSNVFEFEERVASGYISTNYNPNEKFNYSFGLRVEHTNQKGNQLTTNAINENKFTNFFPSAFLKYAPSNNYIFSLSVNNRIVRPAFWQLNPFRYYITPQIFSDGNPFLNPSKTFSTEFSLVAHSKHTFLINYNRQTDVIGQLSRILDDNVLNYYRDNYGVYDIVGGTYVYNYATNNERFESQFTANANYKKLNATPAFNAPFTADGLELDIRLYNYYYFLKDKSLEASLDFYYNKYGPLTQSTLSPVFSMDFTLSKSINNWYLSLFFQDILRTDKYKFELIEDNYRRTNENYYDSRRLVFSLRYSFGKNTVKGKRNRRTNSSIRNRIN
ncbi:TonB-dependent receptor [Aquimarina sp. D1M17]|uniref:TonB-dependent receptor domain-containing protein n=1 Tax=Aquimarina acroporae TaxID=2937283 RepID=UPI0020BFD806|nr:outer membrane beta-barrel family protein [Aquimarina acroporae]MCK8523049.1 TonB-dependent receptor [Aquimarina acroporae]